MKKYDWNKENIEKAVKVSKDLLRKNYYNYIRN